MEFKRQQVIHELIKTEKHYVDDLEVILTVFLRPIAERKIEVRNELALLYCEIETIYSFNNLLMKQLAVREGVAGEGTINAIGDIFLDYVQGFLLYSTYCSNHMAISRQVKALTQSNEAFGAFVKECEASADFRKGRLGDFLIKPLQRICKYPMLLEEILRNTPEEHSDHLQLLEAVAKMKSVCNFVNQRAEETARFVAAQPVSHRNRNKSVANEKENSGNNEPIVTQIVVKEERAIRAKRIRTYSKQANPILVAIQKNDAHTLETMLRNGASAEDTIQGAAIENTEIPLHLAAMQGSPELSGLLIKFGADVNKRDARGWSPLHVACAFAREDTTHLDVVELLIEKGANLSATTEDGSQPIHYLVRNKTDPTQCISVIDEMIQRGVDINAITSKGETPLHYACTGRCSSEIVSFLLEKGGDPFIANPRGNNVLQICILQRRIEFVNILFDKCPNIASKSDYTLLARLAFGSPQIIQILNDRIQPAELKVNTSISNLRSLLVPMPSGESSTWVKAAKRSSPGSPLSPLFMGSKKENSPPEANVESTEPVEGRTEITDVNITTTTPTPTNESIQSSSNDATPDSNLKEDATTTTSISTTLEGEESEEDFMTEEIEDYEDLLESEYGTDLFTFDVIADEKKSGLLVNSRPVPPPKPARSDQKEQKK
eukprot:TRINITY_DN840_c0_g1_i1.p1 TRINITY_DN840_c0_g1~~TRINITY_DN840_c0_g1_i1.p1  ORF type:complete len:663 (+),score=185.71 TRINITY_DN840_c0_g1_i1:477-2465(+)